MKKLLLTLSLLPATLVFADSAKPTLNENGLPIITKYHDLEKLNNFNTELRKINMDLKCPRKNYNKQKAFWDKKINTTFNELDLVSVKIRSTYNCTGLHPVTNEDKSLTYDLKNDRKLRLSSLIKERAKTYKFLRSEIYKNLPDESCKEKLNFYVEGEKLIDRHLAFNLENEHINFMLKLPHGLRFCEKEFKISYQDLLENTDYTIVMKRLKTKLPKKK